MKSLLVGDSLAVGLRAPLARLLPAGSLTTSAEVGTTIGQWQRKIQGVAGGPFEVVLVSLGTNDMRLSAPSSELEALRSLIASARALAPRVVWLLPPSMPFPDRGVREMIASQAFSAGVELLQLPDVFRSADSVHYTPAGYEEAARAVFDRIVQGLGVRETVQRIATVLAVAIGAAAGAFWLRDSKR